MQARDGMVACHPGVVGEIPGVGSGVPEKGLALLGRVDGQHVGLMEERGESMWHSSRCCVWSRRGFCPH